MVTRVELACLVERVTLVTLGYQVALVIEEDMEHLDLMEHLLLHLAELDSLVDLATLDLATLDSEEKPLCLEQLDFPETQVIPRHSDLEQGECLADLVIQE